MRVLILEDLPSDVELAERELETVLKNYMLRVVDTEKDFVHAMAAFKPDLIISDYQLPAFDGLSALRIARTKSPFTPFIILTGSMNEETAVECMNAGADDYVIKEHIKRLGNAVCSAIEKKKTEYGHQQAVVSLRESEAFLKTLLDAIPIPVFYKDKNLRFLGFNKAFETFFGNPKEQLIGKTIFDIYPPELAEIYHAKDRELLVAEGIQRYESQINNARGELRDVVFNKATFTDSQGVVSGLVGAFLDLTEHKQAEEALRESEERYRTFFDQEPDGVVILDTKNTRLIEFNDQACRQLGYSREELARLQLSDIEAKESTEEIQIRIQTVLSKGYDEFETLQRTKHGEIRQVYVIARVVEINKLPVYHCIWRDITEAKQAEIKLLEREEKFRNLFNNAEVGMFRTRLDGSEVLDVNERFLSIFGRTREEMLGKPSVICWADPRERQGMVRRLQTEDSISNFECGMLNKQGQTRKCLISFKIYREQEILEGSILDITELRELQVQFLQAQKMEAIGRLAGGVAHDFNNLLTIITGYAKFALDDLKKETPLYDNIIEILEAGQRATSLTRQLLAFSRKQVIQPHILNLNDILNGTEKMLHRLIGEDIELTSAYDPELWNTEVDPGQVEQVVMNLAVNARDAMPHGGKLTIETSNIYLDEDYFRRHMIENTPGPYVMLTITDNGMGMDKETCYHIFEPFYTTKERGKGTGLGLSTVYGIVKQNKGFIWVYSEPGKGTSFKIYLPAAKGDDGPTNKKEKILESRLKGTETVLLVEDDEKLRKMAQKIFKSYGYTVFTASDSDEAFKISDEYKAIIHLLLTDLIMPGMNGKELAVRIESQRPEIKVLYMSGYAEYTIAHQGILDKNTNFIQKPFLPDDLVRNARKVLDQKTDGI